MKHYVTFKNIGRDINIHIYIYMDIKRSEKYTVTKNNNRVVSTVWYLCIN